MYSGIYSAINGVGNVGEWSLKETVPVETIVNSATRGGTDRRTGIKDVSGSVTVQGKPPYMPGESFTFVGYTSPTSGVYNTAGMRYSCNVIVTGITVNWDFAENKVVNSQLQIAGSGALTAASGAAVVDATNVSKVQSKACLFQYGAGPTELIANRQTATLNMSNAATAYSHAGSGAYKLREAGTLDWTLAIVTAQDTVPIAVDTVLDNLRLYVSATEYFEFGKALVLESTDIKVKPGTSEIITQTVNIGMLASDPTTGALSFIKKPGVTASNWWP